MTDNEIIKAYGCCNLGDFGGCKECPCEVKNKCIVAHEEYDLEREVFNLLNHQKAEIERLSNLLVDADKSFNKMTELYNKAFNRARLAKAEAIKEFAERLISKVVNTPFGVNCSGETDEYKEGCLHGLVAKQNNILDMINNLVKEMTGDNNVSK